MDLNICAKFEKLRNETNNCFVFSDGNGLGLRALIPQTVLTEAAFSLTPSYPKCAAPLPHPRKNGQTLPAELLKIVVKNEVPKDSILSDPAGVSRRLGHFDPHRGQSSTPTCACGCLTTAHAPGCDSWQRRWDPICEAETVSVPRVSLALGKALIS